MKVIADTPIWSLFLRRRRGALGARERLLKIEFSELIKRGQVVLIGAIRQEILSGLRDAAAFERLRGYLRYFDDEALTTEDHEEAARCHNECRAAGIAGSAIDFLICAAALRRGLAVFTDDRDFLKYASCLPLRLHQPDHA